MSTSDDKLVDLAPVRFGIGVGLLFCATTVCERIGTGVVDGVVLLSTVCVVAALGLPLRFALGLGLVAWALLTGFLVNAGGQLTFTEPDLIRAAVLLTVAAVPSAVIAPAPRTGSVTERS